MKFLHVVEARRSGPHSLYLRFNDGAEGEVDLLPVLGGPIFEPLRQDSVFAGFSVEGGTVSWPNGADFAPEFLRELLSRTASRH